MQHTFEDLQKIKRHEIEDRIYIFGDNTLDLEFVDLSRDKNLREIRVEKPQPNLKFLD